MTESDNSFNHKVFRGIFAIFGGKSLTLLISLISTPIIVRILGPDNYGDYAFVLSFMGILSIFTRAGISAGIRKYIAERNREAGWKEEIFGFYSRFALSLSLIGSLLVLGLAVSGTITTLFGDQFFYYFIVLAVIIIIKQLYYISRHTLMGLQKEQYTESINILNRVLFASFAIVLAITGFGVVGVLMGTAVASAISALISLWFLHRYIPITSIFSNFSLSISRSELIMFNITNTIFIFLATSLYQTDILLLRFFIGSGSTGIYKSALNIAEFLWYIPLALQTVFLHSSSQLVSEGRINALNDLISRTTRYNLIFSILITIGLFALADPFVNIYYGTDYSVAVDPLLILLPGALGFAIARPIYATNQGAGKLKTLIIATSVAAGLNFLLNLILIPQYGMEGAAVATTIGYTTMFASHVIASYHLGIRPLSDIRLKKLSIVSSLSALGIFVADAIIIDSIGSLLLVPPFGFVVYTLLTLKTGLITVGEFDSLFDNLPDPFGKLGKYYIRKFSG